MPKSAVPTVPIPVHTAYPVPTGSVLSASPRRRTLTTMLTRVSTDGTRRVKPSVYFSPIAQPISNKPARARYVHAMTGPPSLAGPPPRPGKFTNGGRASHPKLGAVSNRLPIEEYRSRNNVTLRHIVSIAGLLPCAARRLQGGEGVEGRVDLV